jgi:arsenite-transporting ATPase
VSTARLLLMAGKGGVGKTTVAAATAVAAAACGNRTLVVSLDRAHSLGDVLRIPLGPGPTPLPSCDALWAMELDPQAELHRHWGVLQRYLGQLFRYLGMSGATADEMAILPGLEELLTLARLSDLLAADDYDLVVADLAPTASSLRYLSFPDLVAGPLKKWLALDHAVVRLLRPLQGRGLDVPLPEDGVYEGVAALAGRLGRLRDLLADAQRAAVRLVMVPESVVLDETERALGAMSLFGLNVDAVVVNRVLPEEAAQGFLGSWHAVQAGVLTRASASFAEVALLPLPWQPAEVLGIPALARLASALYGDRDPGAFFRAQPPLQFREEGGGTVLTIAVPRAPGDALDLRRRDQELIVTVGGWRRAITLPASLVGRSVKARLAAGTLYIRFEAAI